MQASWQGESKTPQSIRIRRMEAANPAMIARLASMRTRMELWLSGVALQRTMKAVKPKSAAVPVRRNWREELTKRMP